MAYTDFDGRTILNSWGRFKIAASVACKMGDLLARDGTLADADANKPAYCVALEDGAAADEIWAAKGAEVQKRTTVGVGGATTRGNHSGTADDILWLSATAGSASATPVATIGQMVGVVLTQDTFILEPDPVYDANIELVATDKTLDVEDCGKQMYVTSDGVTVSLPATATEFNFVVVNGGNDGAQLMNISPLSVDLITGPDVAGADSKDWKNTKATARAGDRIEVRYRTATGYVVTKLIGIWTQDA